MTKGPKPPPIEQARRAFIETNRELYAYVEAHVAAREWKRAGDTVSGARDGYDAANRCWSESGRWLTRRDAMRAASED